MQTEATAQQPHAKRSPHARPSRRHVLSKVDGRSKLGRFIRDTQNALITQLGGAPSPAERLMIKTVAIKAARLFQIEADLIEATVSPGPEDYQRLAWLNSLTKDLAELGLKPVKDGKGYREPGKRGNGGIAPAQRDGGTLADYAATRQQGRAA